MPFNVTSRSLVTVTRLLPLLVPAANLLPEAVDGLLLDAEPRESTPRGDHIFPVALFPLGLTGIPRVWPRWEEDARLNRLCGC